MEKIRKTSSVLASILKVIRGIVFGAGCVLLVFSVFTLFVPLERLAEPDVTLELGFVELHVSPDFLPENTRYAAFSSLFGAMLSMVGTWIMLGILIRIFGTMTDGRPFSAAQHIRNLAWVYLVFSLINEIMTSVTETLQYTALGIPTLLTGGNIVSCMLRTEMDLGFLFVFAVLLLLSYVFRYGEELQHLDDETL